jgi:hypothetical protein
MLSGLVERGVLAVCVVAVAAVVGLAPDGIVGRSGPPTASAQLAGPAIGFGDVTAHGSTVRVPIVTSGSGFDPYTGFNVRLRWDPAVFAFHSAERAGTVISSPFCVEPFFDSDPDGGGVIWACTTLDFANPTTTTGLLGTIVLSVVSERCSNLHLFTHGPPDGGDGTSGTYTLDLDSEPQNNTYGPDMQACAAGPPGEAPTPDPDATAVPGDTPAPAEPGAPGGPGAPGAPGAPGTGAEDDVRPPGTGSAGLKGGTAPGLLPAGVALLGAASVLAAGVGLRRWGRLTRRA